MVHKFHPCTQKSHFLLQEIRVHAIDQQGYSYLHLQNLEQAQKMQSCCHYRHNSAVRLYHEALRWFLLNFCDDV